MSKRIKHVFSTGELPHIWIRDNITRKKGKFDKRFYDPLADMEPNGRTGGNIYFDGRNIYSYGSHFCIASFHKTRNDVVFFTTRHYSSSTSGHVSHVRRAIPENITVVECPYPEDAERPDGGENKTAYIIAIRPLWDHSIKLRTRLHTRAVAFIEKERLIAEYQTFLKYTGTRKSARKLLASATGDKAFRAFILNSDITGAVAEVERQTRHLADAAKKKEQERAALYEEAQKTVVPEILQIIRERVVPEWIKGHGYVSFGAVVTAEEKERFIPYSAVLLEQALFNQIREERQRAFEAIPNKPDFQKIFLERAVPMFRTTGHFPDDFADILTAEELQSVANYLDLIPSVYDIKHEALSGDLLRIDGKEVITSQDAHVPLKDAAALYRRFISGKPIHGAEIGGFTVLQVSPDEITIGCHHIKRAEIENFGRMIAG